MSLFPKKVECSFKRYRVPSGFWWSGTSAYGEVCEVSQGHQGLWEQTGCERCVHVGSCTYGCGTLSRCMSRALQEGRVFKSNNSYCVHVVCHHLFEEDSWYNLNET